MAATGTGAAAVVLLFDFRSRLRGLEPPGFELPIRRAGVLLFLATVVWGVVFLPLLFSSAEVDPSKLSPWNLFSVQLLMLGGLGVYLIGGFGGQPCRAQEVAAAVGWFARLPVRELGVGTVAGLGIWASVLLVQLLLSAFLEAVGASGWVPAEPPELVRWIVGLPAGWKIALACTAGLVEESFFRGLLQPQLGWLLSSVLFALAHAGYGEPILFGGLFVFSGLVSWLASWRQSVWAAVVAHTVFDLLQLFLVLPVVLDWSP